MITVITAHYAEAACIVDYFQLNKTNNNLYEGDKVCVLITGQGALSVEATLQRFAHVLDSSDKLINFGIAGHVNCNIGELVLINAIIMDSYAIALQTQVGKIFESSLKQKPLRSVQSLQDYEGDMVQDMELTAIYHSLVKRCNAHKLISVKLISDNQSYPINLLSKRRIKTLLDDASPAFIRFLDCAVV